MLLNVVYICIPVTNKELIRMLGVELDKIIPGEVLVIFTVKDLKRSFPALRSVSRVQRYLEFPQINSINCILSNLKLNISKWTRPTSSSQEEENDRILEQLGEKIFHSKPTLEPDDVAQLCRDVYQTSIQIHLKSLPDTQKPCACKCCVTNLRNEFPPLSEWEQALASIVELKKSYQSKKESTNTDPEEELVSPTLSFASVGGLDNQIEILKENILLPLRNKEKLKELGWDVEPVRGFIFHGPQGTGKTLLGKALAAELSRLEEGQKFSFIYHKGTECHGMYVGQTEGRLREIFADAKKKKPAIIFLDEIDGLCEARKDGKCD